MVASDTLVGVIGAGILLVALAGVFVFESRDTSVNKDFAVAETAVAAKDPSSVVITPGGGTRPQPGVCLPQPTPCTDQSITLKLTLGNLPIVDAASKGTYVASVTGAGKTAIVFGPLVAAGDDFKIDQAKNNPDLSGYTTVVVSYETTATPSAPSDVHVFEKAFTATGTSDLKGTFAAKMTAGTAKATLRDTDAGVQVDVTASGLANHTGFVYRVWLHTDGQDVGYAMVGTLTAGNTTLSGSAGGKAADYDHVMITVEPSGFAPAKTAAATGGPNAFVAALKGATIPNAPR